MKNVAFHNLGCKVNSYELDVVQQNFVEKGYKIVPFDQNADVYIINTCTVTNIADRKSRQMLHQAKKRNPDAVVVALGCYVQTGKENVEMDECIDIAIGNNKKKDTVAIVEAYLAQLAKQAEAGNGAETRNEIEAENRAEAKNGIEAGNRAEARNRAEAGIEAKAQKQIKAKQAEPKNASEAIEQTIYGKMNNVIDINHTDEYEEMTLTKAGEHTRAYIKIQDGCNQFCTYCIIPFARGRVRSRLPEDICSEIEGLAKKGYREFVLTGIHISSYGVDFADNKLRQSLLKERKNMTGVSIIEEKSITDMSILEEEEKSITDMPIPEEEENKPVVSVLEERKIPSAVLAGVNEKENRPSVSAGINKKGNMAVPAEMNARDTARYGKDTSLLLELILRIHRMDGVERIRLGSLEPQIVTESFAKTIGRLPKICPHFHLSLQSGYDETLKRMNRHYTTEEFAKGVERLRTYFANPAITTDVIVGFPGETEEEFAKTREFLQKTEFFEMHIFPYSARKGTVAAGMKEQVGGEIKKQRSHQLLELEKVQSEAYRKQFIGKEEEVLFEESKNIEGKTYAIGHTTRYVKVVKETEEDLSGKIISGKIVGQLSGEVLLME